MAVGNPSPSGFSYAQAARGTAAPASQTSSSKTASGAATPANSISLEASSGGNWADDVEDNEGSRVTGAQNVDGEDRKTSLPKDSGVDRAKAEDKLLNGTSGMSSPGTAGSSTASTATRDDSPSAPTGSSSDITWDTKSQASEPAWIAERKERQNGSNGSDGTAKPERKGKKKEKESAPKEEPKIVVLQEAAPPTVNPWLKRAEEAKAKTTTSPKPAQAPATTASAQKENQAPPASRKSNSVPSVPREPINGATEGTGKVGAANDKRTNEVRITNRQNSKPATAEGRSEARPARAGTPQSRSAPNLMSSIPSVKDEISWPTPETAQDQERKESQEKAAEKDSDDKKDEDGASSVKRKKSEWRPMAVTPNVIWETQSMNEPRERKPRPAGSERGGRGGGRGRGSVRGGAAAANGGDRHAGKPETTSVAGDSEQATKGVAPTSERAIPSASVKPNAGPPADSKNAGSDASTPASQVLDPKDASAQINGGAHPESRRARSPKKTNPTNDDVPTPAPIPRQPNTAAQGADASDKPRGEPPVRMIPTEARKEPRNGDMFRDPSWTGSRGKRTGRGRGGHGAPVRDLANGHPYGTNFSNDFNGSSHFGASPSPGYSRGNHHQFSYPPPGSNRGGWARGGPRSHSIPIESYYPRFNSQPYGNSHGQMPNINTFMPGFPEYGMPPMSAVMPTPQEQQENLLMMVTVQLEYYFGVENLIRDIFLRKHMDSQGFVFLDFIAGFNRLKQLTSDKDLLKLACLNSEIIEIRVGEDGKERLRKREGWEQFVRPLEERDASAQTDGPAELKRPERPQMSMPNGPSHFQGPYSAGVPGMPSRMNQRSYDSGMPMMNGFAPHFVPNGDFNGSIYGDAGNGEEMRGRSAKSPFYENGIGLTDRPSVSTEDDGNFEPDAFPDEQTSALGIVVRMSEQVPPYHSAATRTFSNGSIDSRSIATEMDKKPEAEGRQLPNGIPHVNGENRLPSLTRHLSPTKSRSPEQSPPNVEREVTWAKDVSNIPPGTTYEPYTELRMKALDQRNHASTGNCPYDLDVLFQFWCHFLCRNFNNRMYGEFRSFALADARERHSLTGVNNLLKFYAHSLNSPDSIRDRIAKDYVDLVKNEPSALDGAAFKQLRSAWRNGALNLKNRKKLSDIMDEQLKVALDKSEA